MNRQTLLAWGCLLAVTVAGVQGVRAAQDWQRAHLPLAQQQRQKSRGGDHPVLDMMEFSDFQCPACAQAFHVLHPLLERYPHQLRLQFRHHPWPRHRWGMTAAIAAECAARQGRFWAYHDLLFTRQQAWAASQDATAVLKGYAAELQLRQAVFDRCLDGQEPLAVIQGDMAEGNVWDVKSTPTFVINNKVQIVGSQMLQQELPAIEARLKEGQKP